jgi:hypothetical protein
MGEPTLHDDALVLALLLRMRVPDGRYEQDDGKRTDTIAFISSSSWSAGRASVALQQCWLAGSSAVSVACCLFVARHDGPVHDRWVLAAEKSGRLRK